ncbi:hypothetical protein C8R46DRAFT_1275290 [Mycena filopes]|nr:hypothetical protein C8R46DRAFT_1275290 [Mycena filopes]
MHQVAQFLKVRRCVYPPTHDLSPLTSAYHPQTFSFLHPPRSRSLSPRPFHRPFPRHRQRGFSESLTVSSMETVLLLAIVVLRERFPDLEGFLFEWTHSTATRLLAPLAHYLHNIRPQRPPLLQPKAAHTSQTLPLHLDFEPPSNEITQSDRRPPPVAVNESPTHTSLRATCACMHTHPDSTFAFFQNFPKHTTLPVAPFPVTTNASASPATSLSSLVPPPVLPSTRLVTAPIEVAQNSSLPMATFAVRASINGGSNASTWGVASSRSVILVGPLLLLGLLLVVWQHARLQRLLKVLKRFHWSAYPRRVLNFVEREVTEALYGPQVIVPQDFLEGFVFPPPLRALALAPPLPHAHAQEAFFRAFMAPYYAGVDPDVVGNVAAGDEPDPPAAFLDQATHQLPPMPDVLDAGVLMIDGGDAERAVVDAAGENVADEVAAVVEAPEAVPLPQHLPHAALDPAVPPLSPSVFNAWFDEEELVVPGVGDAHQEQQGAGRRELLEDEGVDAKEVEVERAVESPEVFASRTTPVRRPPVSNRSVEMIRRRLNVLTARAAASPSPAPPRHPSSPPASRTRVDTPPPSPPARHDGPIRYPTASPPPPSPPTTLAQLTREVKALQPPASPPPRHASMTLADLGGPGPGSTEVARRRALQEEYAQADPDLRADVDADLRCVGKDRDGRARMPTVAEISIALHRAHAKAALRKTRALIAAALRDSEDGGESSGDEEDGLVGSERVSAANARSKGKARATTPSSPLLSPIFSPTHTSESVADRQLRLYGRPTALGGPLDGERSFMNKQPWWPHWPLQRSTARS